MQRLQRVAAIPWKQREHVVVAPAAVQKVVPEEVRHAAVEGVEALRLQLVLCLDARATQKVGIRPVCELTPGRSPAAARASSSCSASAPRSPRSRTAWPGSAASSSKACAPRTTPAGQGGAEALRPDPARIALRSCSRSCSAHAFAHVCIPSRARSTVSPGGAGDARGTSRRAVTAVRDPGKMSRAV